MPNKITYTHIKIFFFCIGLLLVLASAVFWYRSSAAPEATPTPSPNTVHIGNPVTDRWTNGLVGYWSFNGQDMNWASTTAEALDRSGNNNNGNVVNFNKESVVPGKVGQALKFDGVDDYVDVPHSASLNITDAITIEAWVKKYGNGSNPAYSADMVLRGNPELWIYTDNRVLFSIGSTGDTGNYISTSINAINNNNWVHIVGVYDKNGGDNNMKIF